MADEKIASLSIDATQAAEGLNQIAESADRAGEKLAEAAAEVTKTETQIKRLAGSSREYNAAARLVGDSTQNITKFEQAYRASLRDTANAEKTKADILAAAFARTIGGTADETKAMALLNAGHKDAAAGVQMIVKHNAAFATSLNNTAKSSRASAHQYQNLAYQLNDVVSGLAMGQRPMQVLAQQGGQIFQVFSQMNSPLKAIGGLLMTTTGLFTMAGAAIVATAYAGISYGNSIKAMDQALRSSNGMVGLSTVQMEAHARQMAESGKVSVSEADKVQLAFVKAGTVGSRNFGMLTAIMGDVARSMKEDVVTAAEEVAKAMGDPAKAAVDLNGRYWNLTAAQERHIAELVRSGDIEGAQAELIDAMSAKMTESTEKTTLWTRATNALSNAWRNFGQAINPALITDKLAQIDEALAKFRNAPQRYQDSHQSTMAALQAERDRLQAQLDAANGKAATRGRAAPGQAAIRTGNALSDKLIPETKKGLEEQAATLLKARDAAKEGTDEYRRLAQAYEAVSNAAATWIPEGQRDVMLAEARAKASTMTAAAGQKYLSEKTAEINMLGRVISASERERLAKAASLETNTAYAKAMREQGKALSLGQIETQAKLAAGAVDQERQALAQRRALGEISAVEEMAQAIAIDDKRRALDEDTAAKKLALLRRTAGTERTEIEAAERALTEIRAKNAAERQKQLDAEVAARRNQIRQLAELSAQAAASAATAGVDSKAESLRFGRSVGDVTGIREIADQERAIANERYQIELDLLNKKLALASQEPVERQNILNQIKALEQKHANEVGAINHRETENRLAEVRSWTEPVKSAMNGMVQGIFAGTLTMRQLVANFGQSIIASYANMAAQAVMKWVDKHIILAAWNALFADQEVAAETAKQGQLTAIRAAGETAQTSATATGVAARTALGATEDASFFSRIGRVIAEWLGLETAKTAGTAAESATRTTLEAASAIAATVSAKTQAISEIPAYAGIGAAAAMASVAAIPVIGWALAPAVGAEHAALAMSFLGLASAEGGWGEVPTDGVQTILHRKEMVLPARYADPLRAALTSNSPAALPRFGLPSMLGRGPNFGGMTSSNSTARNLEGDTHIHIGSLVAKGKMSSEDIADFQDAAIKAIEKGVRNGNRSARYASGRRGSS